MAPQTSMSRETVPMAIRARAVPVAMAFILTGIVAMAAATRQHRRNLALLIRDDYTYVRQTSIATGTALALMAIGICSLLVLIWGALA